MKVIKLKSPAKINVRLDVLKRRSDGYHDLRMINTPVSLYDEIECELVEKGIHVESHNDDNVPSGDKNIVYGVAKEILAYSNKNVGVCIRINKRIPSAAGMGGGSSNAATVLMGLNELLKINLNKEKLMKIGLRFGADVPFFVFGGPAITSGVGDEMVRIKKMPKLPLVLISPNFRVPTKWVYERFAAANDNQPVSKRELDALPDQFATKKSVIKFLNNDLEPITTERYPVVVDLKKVLTKTGAMACQMTGSGPTVFGIYPSREAAEKAYHKISANISDCRVFLVDNIN